MNDVSGIWFLKIWPLYGLLVYKNCQNLSKILAENIYRFSIKSQRLHWLNPIQLGKILTFLSFPKEWGMIVPKLTQQSRCVQPHVRTAFLCPSRQRCWVSTIANDFCCSWPNSMNWFGVCLFLVLHYYGKIIVPQNDGMVLTEFGVLDWLQHKHL